MNFQPLKCLSYELCARIDAIRRFGVNSNYPLRRNGAIVVGLFSHSRENLSPAFHISLYSLSPDPPRGREPVAPARGVRAGARGRGFAGRALGRPWPAVRPHYGGLPSMAGRGGDEGRRKLPGSGAQEGSVSARKLRRRGQKSPRRRAERRHAVQKIA